MSKVGNYELSKGEAAFAAVIGGGLLAVSISQGASYVWGMGSTALEHAWLVGMVCGALLGSQILIRLGILNWKRENFVMAFVCFMLVAGAERFSYITTRDAVQGRAANTIRAENLSSPEYARAVKALENHQRRFDVLADARAKLDATLAATPAENMRNRAAVGKDIERNTRDMNAAAARVERAQAAVNAVNVSVLGGTMRDGGEGMSRLIALLQSAMPIGINIGTMMLVGIRGRRSSAVAVKEVASGKKPRTGGKLRAVR